MDVTVIEAIIDITVIKSVMEDHENFEKHTIGARCLLKIG
jgi:hypothetical protein